jgi:hypothetical protein
MSAEAKTDAATEAAASDSDMPPSTSRLASVRKGGHMYVAGAKRDSDGKVVGYSYFLVDILGRRALRLEEAARAFLAQRAIAGGKRPLAAGRASRKPFQRFWPKPWTTKNGTELLSSPRICFVKLILISVSRFWTN